MPRMRTVSPPVAAAPDCRASSARPPPLSLGKFHPAASPEIGRRMIASFSRDPARRVRARASHRRSLEARRNRHPFAHAAGARRARARCGDLAPNEHAPARHRTAGGARAAAGRRRRAAGGSARAVAARRGSSTRPQAHGTVRRGRPALARELDARRRRAASRRAGTRASTSKPAQAEGLRKLLLALASDVRLVLIRLALQLVRMRSLKGAPGAERRRAALETREIYAPLASRLGIWQVKWELEDLAFRFSAARRLQAHRRLAASQARSSASSTSRTSSASCARELDAAGIEGEITGRPKHIYSIWRKMQRKSLQFEQVMDVLAVRVMVDTIAECYAALGVVHGLWPYIPGEFDDYIATPKDNNYRSLHTAVIGPGKLPLEVQIRTREMHEHAELGVAAHWQYKEGRKAEASFQQKIVWLRQLLEPTQRDGAEPDLLAGLQAEVFEDRVLRVEPARRSRRPAKGRDAARFRVPRAHESRSSLPRRTRERPHGAARSSVSRTATPSRSSRRSSRTRAATGSCRSSGYLASPRNRAKVRALVPQAGRSRRTANRAGRCSSASWTGSACARRRCPRSLADLGLPSAEALLPGARRRRASTLAQVAGAIHRRLHETRSHRRPASSTKPPTEAPSPGMVIDGVGDLMSSIARCCRPVPPEDILGYITIGRGVSIHRASCANLRAAARRRIRSACWRSTGAGRRPERTFPVAIVIDAFDRRGLVRDISGVLADEHISIEAMNTTTERRAKTRRSVDVTVKVHGLEELSRLLSRFSALPNVIRARRQEASAIDRRDADSALARIPDRPCRFSDSESRSRACPRRAPPRAALRSASGARASCAAGPRCSPSTPSPARLRRSARRPSGR